MNTLNPILGGSPSANRRVKKAFDINGLNKVDSIDKPRLNFKQPVDKTLIAPKNAANPFYDKHFIAALDRFK